jgi:hypothetical protein
MVAIALVENIDRPWLDGNARPTVTSFTFAGVTSIRID